MSNEPKHTATPWEIKGNVLFQKGTTKTIATVHIQNNFDSVRGKLVKDTESEANAARIVQCVNACEGLSNEDLEVKVQIQLSNLAYKVDRNAQERDKAESELESLRAEHAELIEALRWNSVEDKLPKPLQTVWLSNGKSWAALGCLVESDGGWHWAESNGVTYLENGEIVSECESDDLDVKFWIALPKPPQP